MDFREEVVEMKKKVEQVTEENKSFAMQFVDTLKEQNKRLFICWLVTFIAFVGLLAYTIWLHNDIEKVETEIVQEIEDVNTIENSVIRNGSVWEE